MFDCLFLKLFKARSPSRRAPWILWPAETRAMLRVACAAGSLSPHDLAFQQVQQTQANTSVYKHTYIPDGSSRLGCGLYHNSVRGSYD